MVNASKKHPVRRWLNKYILHIIIYTAVIAGFLLGASVIWICSAVEDAGRAGQKNGQAIREQETRLLEKALVKTLEVEVLPVSVETAIEEPTEGPEVEPISEPAEEWTEFTATAYCSCEGCCGKSDGITASGKQAVQGVTIAADWDILPCGTTVEIQGYGTYEVQDVGGEINSNKIDIYFDSHQEALTFGVQTVYVKVG